MRERSDCGESKDADSDEMRPTAVRCAKTESEKRERERERSREKKEVNNQNTRNKNKRQQENGNISWKRKDCSAPKNRGDCIFHIIFYPFLKPQNNKYYVFVRNKHVSIEMCDLRKVTNEVR